MTKYTEPAPEGKYTAAEVAVYYAAELAEALEDLRYKSETPALEEWTEPLFRKCDVGDSEPFYEYKTDSTPLCLMMCIFHYYCDMVTYSVESLSCSLYHDYDLKWDDSGEQYCWLEYGPGESTVKNALVDSLGEKLTLPELLFNHDMGESWRF